MTGVSSAWKVECLAGKGLRGDRYFNARPDVKGQVTFFDMLAAEEVRMHFKLSKLPVSDRRKLVVQGIYLAE